MKIPKTTFLATPETEAQRLLDIAIFIVNRFWQIKGFYLLPHDISDFSGQEIYFPDLKYPLSFWDEAKRLAKLDTITMPLGAKKEVVDQVVKLIPATSPESNDIKTRWQKRETEFWKFCFAAFPDCFSKLNSVEVWLTKFDRLGAFNTSLYEVKVWTHFQASCGDIAEGILSSILRQKHLRDGYTWEESEAAIDNLILNSKLHQLFPKWKPTLVGLRTNSNYALESKNYFAKLGFGGNSKLVISKLDTNLTLTEKEILKNLQNRNGAVVNFEAIGDIIWKDRAVEKYSEWAIAQTVHRLREKIQSLGFTSELIQTKRGEGYYLLEG